MNFFDDILLIEIDENVVNVLVGFLELQLVFIIYKDIVYFIFDVFMNNNYISSVSVLVVCIFIVFINNFLILVLKNMII